MNVSVCLSVCPLT